MTQYLTCIYYQSEKEYIDNLLNTDFKDIKDLISYGITIGWGRPCHTYLRFDSERAYSAGLTAWKLLKGRIQSRRYRKRRKNAEI